MIKNYLSFLNEANVKTKITRDDLNVGDDVMTHGEYDGVGLDYEIGKIIAMKEYGNILIEFEKPFSKKFHAGHKDIGEPGHCFYIPLDNISTNDRNEFEKIIKGVGEEKKNRSQRINTTYKEGDIIVGIGEINNGQKIKIDGEVGIVYYENGQGGLDPKDRGDYKIKRYWVGFIDKFDNSLRSDGEGLPMNAAGINIDSVHMRPINKEEQELVEDKIRPLKKQIDALKKVHEVGTVVIVDGNYGGMPFNNAIGIVRQIQAGYGRNKRNYIIQFTHRINDILYDVNNIIGNNNGYILPSGIVREATEEEIEKSGHLIKILKEEIDDFNYDYKNGDYVITQGQADGINFDGQIGQVVGREGVKPMDRFTIQFIANFSNRLYKVGKFENCYKLNRKYISRPKDVDIEEIKKKLDNKEIMTYRGSPSFEMLLNRMGFKVRMPFMTQSFFDVTDKNDMVSYLPINNFKKLETTDDPYKSRLRQVTKIGKLFRMLNKDVTEKDVETLVNAYKGSFDICISGLSDKLRLVSGEDVRYWYSNLQYVRGGGDLNSSCMQYPEKGPEMQMFVDNPDVIQLLILTDDKEKLLGRALVWRLADPPGATFMDYIYTRHDKDKDLFVMFAEQRGWLSADMVYRRNRGGALPTMVCALNTNKKYQMGKNALDHFDTLRAFNTTENYLTNGDINWKRPNPLPKVDIPKTSPEDGPRATVKKEVKPPFELNSKVQYKKEGAPYDGKTGIFVGMRDDDGKYKIVFDDGKKFAALPKNVYPAPIGIKPIEKEIDDDDI